MKRGNFQPIIASPRLALPAVADAARNFEVLHPFVGSHPGRCMLCSDDLKPTDLARGHINLPVKQGLRLGA